MRAGVAICWIRDAETSASPLCGPADAFGGPPPTRAWRGGGVQGGLVAVGYRRHCVRRVGSGGRLADGWPGRGPIGRGSHRRLHALSPAVRGRLDDAVAPCASRAGALEPGNHAVGAGRQSCALPRSGPVRWRRRGEPSRWGCAVALAASRRRRRRPWGRAARRAGRERRVLGPPAQGSGGRSQRPATTGFDRPAASRRAARQESPGYMDV